ncbi:MAG: hypothetical protein P4M00_19195 [Azospirillaceae bacterium]|nr:hypothetical protein [Azospirillaceae bacterium]
MEQTPKTTGAEQASSKVSSGQSTLFAFEHRVFTLKGCYFAPVAESRDAAFHLPLGDGLKGAIALPTLASEFSIEPDSHDGQLLSIIEKSLKFVKEIRPGDSIPREILDGTASWAVKDHHRQIARARLSLQLVSWLTGNETQLLDVAQLAQIAEDAGTRQRVNDATGQIAERLGIGRERREEVLEMIDNLVRELAYIEALRERYGAVQSLSEKLKALARTYRRDSTFRDEIFRMQVLIKAPLSTFDTIFGQVDAQTGEILSVIRNIVAQIKFIRECRDDLHIALMLWDEVIDEWATASTSETNPEVELLLKKTYRFLARNFSVMVKWKSSVSGRSAES